MISSPTVSPFDFGPNLWKAVLSYSIILLSIALIYVMASALVSAPRERDPASISSFFTLDHLISRKGFRIIKIMYALPFAGLYATIAFYSPALIGSASHILAEYLSLIDPKYKDAVVSFFNNIQDEYKPLLVLVLCAILFSTRLRTPLVFYRDALLSAADFYQTVDETSAAYVREAIRKYGNAKDALDAIETAFGRSPLPERLANTSDEAVLSYKIIWHSKGDILATGFEKGIQQTFGQIKLQVLSPPRPTYTPANLFPALMLFCVMLGMYIAIIPIFHLLISPPVDWPEPANSALARYVFKGVLTFVVPLAWGITIFMNRVQHSSGRFYNSRLHRRAWSDIITVGLLMFGTSIVTNYIFMIIEVSRSVYMNGSGALINLSQLKVHIDVFLYSLAPFVSLVIWFYARSKFGHNWGLPLIFSISGGACFCFAQFIFELYTVETGAAKFTFYFLHQFLMGFYLTLALYVSSFIARISSAHHIA